MNRLDTYKEFYQKEIERRSQLNNDISIPLGIISILGTGISFYLMNFDFSYSKTINWIFIIMMFLSTFCLLGSVYFLLKSYQVLQTNRVYDYLAYPNEIEEYYKKLTEYYLMLNGNVQIVSDKTNEDFERYFIDAYLRTSTHNMTINDERTTNLYLCKRKLLYCVIFILCSFIPFLYVNYKEEKKIDKIQITNPIQIKLDSSLINNR